MVQIDFSITKRVNMKTHSHDKKDIIHRLQMKPSLSYLRDWVYGGIDGAVTTFAVVAGVVGAKLSAIVIVVLGLTNLLGDGFSMAAANYLGTKAEKDEHDYYAAQEKEHIASFPEGEEEEVRQIFVNKGFTGHLLEEIVQKITADRTIWVKTMIREEYGLPETVRLPILSGLYTFIAFILCGSVPLLPYMLKIQHPFIVSSSLTGCVFFVIGSLKSKWSIYSVYYSGFTTFAIGAAAASIAFGVGYFLKNVMGI